MLIMSACASHNLHCAELQSVHEALFDHRRSHPCEWSNDDAIPMCVYC